MYYEEKLIGGILHYRSSPSGEWTRLGASHAAAANALAQLATDDERLRALRLFCWSCGRIQPDGRGCQCWNDE